MVPSRKPDGKMYVRSGDASCFVRVMGYKPILCETTRQQSCVALT